MKIIKSNRKLIHLSSEQLQVLISSLAMDIEFYYGDSHGAICPINSKHIDVCFGDYNVPGKYTDIECHSIFHYYDSSIFKKSAGKLTLTEDFE